MILTFIGLILGFMIFSADRSSQLLNHTLALLGDLQTALKNGELSDPISSIKRLSRLKKERTLLVKISQIFYAQVNQGVPMEAQLAVIIPELAKLLRVLKRRSRLVMVVVGRFFLCVIFAAVVRWYFAGTSSIFFPVSYNDYLFCGCSGVLVLLTLVVLERLTAPPLSLRSRSNLSAFWGSLLALTTEADSPLASKLAGLTEREWRYGVSLRHDKQHVVREYLIEEELLFSVHLQKVEEYLPLFDLFGVGVALFLAVYVPVMTAISF